MNIFTEYVHFSLHMSYVQGIKNFIQFVLIIFPHSQAIGSPNALEQILKSLLFYIITNLEAFIFCFAGEYLSSKVNYKLFMIMMKNR